MAKDVLHVVPSNEGWAVKKEGNERSSSTHDTQRDAIESARNLARNGDDIVIHRPDGTIRDRTTYTEPQSDGGTGGTMKDRERADPHDLVSVGSRVSWQAILAGAAVTLTLYLILSLLALAVGASTLDQVQYRTFRAGAAVAGIVSLLGSMFLGGYIVSRMTARETHAEAIIYGVLMWATVFFILLVTGLNMGSNFGMLTAAARPAAPAAGVGAAGGTGAATATADIRQKMEARGEYFIEQMEPAELAWWAFGAAALSVAAAVGGSLVGAGPELRLPQFVRTQAPAGGGRVVAR